MRENNHSAKKASPPELLRTDGGKTTSNAIQIPSINLPKGGAAIKGIDEKFSVNAVNGSSSFSVPLPVSPARGATPALSLIYNSGSGNGIFGLGWSINLPSVKRKTDKHLPQYADGIDSDTFLLSEAEDLVPEFKKQKKADGSVEFIKENDDYVIHETKYPNVNNATHIIRYYRPRIEGLFARIERWTGIAGAETGISKWRVITKENTTTLFGWSAQSRKTDPADNSKIFEWLPEFVFDDKGNCAYYQYKKENAEGLDQSLLSNRNRIQNNSITYTNLYLEKVFYGNKIPYKTFGDAFPQPADYLFSTVFDYGEYDNNIPDNKIKEWDYRADAFSDYKAGFEIRTTRICKRVLLLHHFTGAEEYNGLVRSVNFSYDTSAEQNFTFLKSITSCGYIKKPNGTYSSKQLPPIEFTYQKHEWNKEIKAISTEDLVHTPSGLNEQQYQFIDLYNEGLAGILTEQANGWYYKHNLGGGKFEQATLVSPKPSFAGLGAVIHLSDLDSDGGKQVVSFSNMASGYFELTEDREWQRFRSFPSLPNINFADPNARMLDLNGDGRPEIVIAEENVFTWYASEGRLGFSQARKAAKPFDEEKGPNIVFADGSETIFLADMCGDGMTDIVRIRNGEVCYWPNLGFGKFGAKVTMDQSPVFDHADVFNPSYLRLADIDGSGTTDIIYLGKNKFTCWKNLSGNRFGTKPFEVDAFPEIHSHADITVSDLLGDGVACIVYSSPLEKDAQSPLRYINLMNSKKPHILVSYKNNLGKETLLEYTASTKFYIEDKLAGKPWVTRLHFPVHCISKTITEDKISGSRFVSEYKYHHGYYDHAEREFRGFGMVEQTDTETFEHWIKGSASNIVEELLHQEPMVSKTWFHTGAFIRKDNILDQFKEEYWYAELERKGFSVVHHEKKLPDARLVTAPGLDASVLNKLCAQEWQEALRACKGMRLRSEVFAKDAIKFGNTEAAQKKQATPFSVSIHNCIIELIQPKGKNKHAVFVVKESEAITYSYERNAEDPRIAHNLNIKLDEYGNVLESAAVVYPRKMADTTLPAETQTAQSNTVIIYAANKFTNDAITADAYRLRLPSETASFELKGVGKSGNYYAPGDFDNILADNKSETVAYHEVDKPLLPGKAQKRLIEQVRTLYLSNNLSVPLPLHQLESLAIAYESYQLAYTPQLLSDIYDAKVNAALLTEGRFISSEGDENWWIRSGTIQFLKESETPNDATNRFFVPVAYTDPYGAVTKIKYYSDYFLFIEETEDALGNRSGVEVFNFRTMAPQRMRDINNNLSEAISDELGFIKAMAVMGKGNEADDLTGLAEITSMDEVNVVQDFFNAPDSVQLTIKGKSLLQHATTRFVYDLEAYGKSGKPAVVAAITREEHFQKNNNSPVQIAFEYSNGIGEVVMKKVQAEPGIASQVMVNGDTSITIIQTDTSTANPKQLRWIGNGRTVKNNKGNPVKQYEPYFSVNHHYEDYKELVETGVTPLLYYDAAGRLIKTAMPDGSFSKVEFDSWKQTLYDANDTVLESSWYINRTNRLIDAQLLAEGKDPEKEKQAADKAAKHANTPGTMHLDTLGRPVLSTEHNKIMNTGADEFYHTKLHLDTEGNLRSVIDARGNVVMQYKYDMLGNKVYQNSMDAGQRWLFANILGAPLRSWDQRNFEFQYFYDVLQRPTQSKVSGGDGDTPLNNIFGKAVYGESLLLPGRTNEADLQAKNILGQAIQRFDTGGLTETPNYDFKGQPISTTKKLFSKYKEAANWTDASLFADLEPESFTFTNETDALGRITRQVAPDGSIITPGYNEAGLLTKETVLHPGTTIPVTYIKDIDYNEKGQRERIVYGNDVSTRFYFDATSFRLKRLESKRLNNDPLQDWHYTFDAVGNITHIEDKNIPVVFFNNQKVTGTAEYTYDALYRLVKATGRESNTSIAFTNKDNWNDTTFAHILNAGDPVALRNYTQQYEYDEVGNIKQMRHIAMGNTWTRDYAYEANNNRLLTTQVGGEIYQYPHHAQHGFITVMPHLEEMNWNFKEELVKTICQKRSDGGTAETTWYQYDGGGQRIRKITENQAAPGEAVTKKEERIYIGGYELYKKHSGKDAGLERSSLSLVDGEHRFVMIETRNDVDDGTEKQLTRYQLHNHLGSAAMELDSTAQIISYEEYHPYGTTAYQAKNAAINSTAKRYRYTGMERDEETGLEYHSARYYLPWLGRWLSGDPIGTGDGVNIYAYVKNRPSNNLDKSGKQANSPNMPTIYLDESGKFSLEPPTNSEVLNNLVDWEGTDTEVRIHNLLEQVDLPKPPVNKPDDLMRFIFSQAGFEAGAESPLSFNRGAASSFGTKAHAKTTTVLDEVKLIFPGAENLFSEVRVENGIVTQIGGTPGGPRGSHNLDIVVVIDGQQLHVGDIFKDKVDTIGDYKYGGGKISQKYDVHGADLVTINSEGVEPRTKATKTTGGAVVDLTTEAAETTKLWQLAGTTLRRIGMALPVIDVAVQQIFYDELQYTGSRPEDAFINLTIAEVWEVPTAVYSVTKLGAVGTMYAGGAAMDAGSSAVESFSDKYIAPTLSSWENELRHMYGGF